MKKKKAKLKANFVEIIWKNFSRNKENIIVKNIENLWSHIKIS